MLIEKLQSKFQIFQLKTIEKDWDHGKCASDNSLLKFVSKNYSREE